MGRRTKPPPMVLAWEDVATGMQPSLRDDFTGEEIPQAAVAEPRVGAQERQDAANLAQLRDKRMLLEHLGILPRSVPADTQPKLVAPRVAGMRPVARLGDHALQVPLPPWRRG